MSDTTLGPGRAMRISTVVYLWIEAVGICAMWVYLLARPESREPFIAPGAPDSTFLAFALPDLALYGGSAAICAIAIRRRLHWAFAALCFRGGACLYATFYFFNLYLLEPSTWMAAVVIAPVLLITIWLLIAFRPRATGSSTPAQA